ncbi:MAG: DUF302 domain-containing protein [Candidatus Micrarchaeia archaeon]
MTDGIITVKTEKNFDITFSRLIEAINKRRIPIFAIIDHKDNAQKVGMRLTDAKVVIFGKPEAGTKLMQEHIDIAIDLPLRLLIYGENGYTTIAYYDPAYLGNRYGISSSSTVLDAVKELLSKIVEEATS